MGRPELCHSFGSGRRLGRGLLRAPLGSAFLGAALLAAALVAAPPQSRATAQTLDPVPPQHRAAQQQAPQPTPPQPEALPAPDATPAFDLPDPAQIHWQITQRFASFATLPDPVASFQDYQLLPGESLRAWHQRMWANQAGGFSSPYAAALRGIKPLRRYDLTLTSPARATLPWDHSTQLHRPQVLEVLRNETNPDYKVAITLSYPEHRPCTWDVGGGRVLSAQDCAQPVAWQVPITGATLSLRFDGAVGGATFRVQPRHKVILGLGDSYGSGEGNPDLPAGWRPDFTPPANETTWLIHNDRLSLRHRARWLDERCHRSFFSAQSLAAFAEASYNPHQIVTFLHYACTGAEIFDGILVPQYAPGRIPRRTGGHNRFSQLNAALIELCRGQLSYRDLDPGVAHRDALKLFERRGAPQPSTLHKNDEFERATRKQRDLTGDIHPRGMLLKCPKGALRAPDQILLSIGGNDIGFGNIIRYFLAPLGTWIDRAFLPDFCPAPDYRYPAGAFPDATRHCDRADRTPGYHSGTLIGFGEATGMRARYGILARALWLYLGVRPDQVVMPLYPDSLRAGRPGPAHPGPARPDPAYCGPAEDLEVAGAGQGYDPLSPFNGLKGADPTGTIGRWPFNLTKAESALALGQIEDLRRAQIIGAEAAGFTLVCASRDAFLGHGWWRGAKLSLPSHGSAAARWRPAEWQPYAFSRTDRAVRTANDSLMTQASGKYDVHGTFHPNLTGHSLLADAILARTGLRTP